MKIPVWHLDWYGLKEKDLKNLNNKIEIKLFLKWPPVKKMLVLTVPERKRFSEKYHQELLQKTIASFSLGEVFVDSKDRRDPDVFKAVITGPNLFKLISSSEGISAVQIEKVHGRKQIETAKFPKPEPDWYLVTGLFVYQIKGKATGTQSQEERAYLVFAKSLAEAERKATRAFKKMEHVYLGGEYDIVRHKFVELVDSKIVVSSDNGQFDKNELHYILSHDLPSAKITPTTAWK